MSLAIWKLDSEQRWHISMTLKTASPLHIGSGVQGEHDDIYLIEMDTEGNKTKKFADINECIKGKNNLSPAETNNLPIIPGSSIKGSFLSWLIIRIKHETKTEFEQLRRKLFGDGHDKKTAYQGRAGKVEFHDAYISKELKNGSTWPYWRKEKQTFIDTSTSIDRHRKTALNTSLHYTECIPPGVVFTFTFTGFMNEQEAGMLIALLDSFYSDENQPFFGAGNANGYGHMEYVGDLNIKQMGSIEIAQWLADFKTNNMPMAMEKASELNLKKKQQLIDQAKTLFKSGHTNENIPITLKFDGPFLVNDSQKVKQLESDTTQKTDHFPLLDTKIKPKLPNSSIRGALRSQAERIIRTLGGPCCDTQTPCPPIYKTIDLNKLCLACQIFGASGWKTVININEFTCQNSPQRNKQEFVAIDRFHGGGKGGAKFDATVFENPIFTGAITFSPRMQEHGLNWGKGLLSLLLKDLDEGDITFGLGANKGYGHLEKNSSKINFQQFDESDMDAFRNKFSDLPALWQSWAYSDKWDMFLEAAQAWHCDEIKKPTPQGDKVPIISTASTDAGFLNPYQFIPISAPSSDHWYDQELGITNQSPHSHGFYRNQTEMGELLHHGRISCQLTTETPVFIGAEQTENTEPIEVANYKLNNKIAIPATSLRGMVSSLAEAASNSSMRVLDNGLLSFRKSADDALKKIGMTFKVGKNRNKIIPIVNNIIKLKNAYEPGEMMAFIHKSQSWSTEHNQVYYLSSTSGIPEKIYSPGMKPGILRILGKEGRDKKQLENKKHELFIQIPLEFVDINLNLFNYKAYVEAQIKNNNSIALPEQVIKRYSDLANQRTLSQKSKKELKNDNGKSVQWFPFHLKGTQRVRDNKHDIYNLEIKDYDLIYYDNNRNEVTEISFSSIWRDRVEENSMKPSTAHDFVPVELRPFTPHRTKISPTELLFGFVELNQEQIEGKKGTTAFAGKVRISAGIACSEDLVDEQNPITLKTLSSPKLPSPPLYFNSANGSHDIAKEKLNTNDYNINGRKYYLHAMQKDNEVQKLSSTGNPRNGGGSIFPWVTQHNEEDPQLKVKITPIKKQKSFKFDVDFNNLTDWEIGLLCYSLRPTETFRHRLGMAKPLGLGTVKINIEEIKTINRKHRYLEDTIESYRYNKAQKLSIDQLRKIFTETMNPDIYRALDLLGNPSNVKYPVHYPQVENGDIEIENYKWFVANDNPKCKNRQMLKGLKQDTDSLPTLTKHR